MRKTMRLSETGIMLASIVLLFILIFPVGSSNEPFDTTATHSQTLSWKMIWEYPLEHVSHIAASEYGIAIGGKNGLIVLDLDGEVVWERQGKILDLDMKNDMLVISHNGVIEIYDILGSKLACYDEGFVESISLSKYGIIAARFPNKVSLLDISGNILQEYETGTVGTMTISSDGTMMAYRKTRTVTVLDILGEIEYTLEDGGSMYNQVIVTSSGWILTYAEGEAFLYNGEQVVWSSRIGGCEPGLAVSEDETKFAISADRTAIYAANGELLSILPKGSCGSIAFLGDAIVASDTFGVYYLGMEETLIQGDFDEKGTSLPSSASTSPSLFPLLLTILATGTVIIVGIVLQKKRKKQKEKYLQILEELESQDNLGRIEKKQVFEYDIAISFAGEDREIAKDLAKLLRAKGVRVFYDEFFRHELWGKKLTEYFQNIYGSKTKFVISLISRHYPIKDWTDFEFSIMRKEAKSRQTEFILPVKIDNTKILGIHEDIGYLDYKKEGIDGIVDCLVKKLS
jgi:hypothetical protein